MKALQDNDQAAGNDWGNRPQVMLHKVIPSSFLRAREFSNSNTMFDDLERQMRDSEADYNSLISVLREKYVFTDPDAIKCFINMHRRVAPLLLEAAPHLSAAFGVQVPLTLEVIPDDEAPQSIHALAIWDGESAKARVALRSFDEGWLNKNFQAINGRIVFDYELI